MAEVVEGDVTQDSEQQAIEAEAREMGWNPNHKGDKFIPAAEFVERGKSILPIVQATNARLRADVEAAQAEAAANAAALKALQAGQEALEEAREADLAEARAEAKAEAKAELARASEAGDHAGVADATAKLTDLSVEERDAAAAKKVVDSATGAGGRTRVDPAVKAWLGANKDFARDPEKIALGNVIAAKMRKEGDTRTGAEFLDDVANRVEQRLGGSGSLNKVEQGGASSGRTGGGKSYNDLPADAKAACDRMAGRLVGNGRAHKDIGSWQKAYAAKYFAGEQR